MTRHTKANVGIVDYGMGNLFSVQQACLIAGLKAEISSDPEWISQQDAIILPGVGAFRDAMISLGAQGMTQALANAAKRGTPILGICLGLQLFMEKSHEFGEHHGLGFIAGSVEKLPTYLQNKNRWKVPNVGWRGLYLPPNLSSWDNTLLSGLPSGSSMYFVHSYYVKPVDSSMILALTRHHDLDYCSVLQKDNLIGFQCHPERSANDGLLVYRNFAKLLK